jgi:hypothetical protein
MQLERPLVAMHPCGFGRGRARIAAVNPSLPWRLSDDVKLFATTFIVGFVFVSVLIS